MHTFPTVAIVSESSLLELPEAEMIAAAINTQVARDFGPVWFHKAGIMASSVDHVPAGAWLIHVLDNADQEGALGYHDEDGNEIPYTRVFAETIKKDGAVLSEVISHEILEMLIDPHVNFTAIDPTNEVLVPVEVCDAVQENFYIIDGFQVADFVKPNWFDPKTSHEAQTNFNVSSENFPAKQTAKGPWKILPEGYLSYLDLKNLAAGWQDIFGDKQMAKSGPHADRKLRRITKD